MSKYKYFLFSLVLSVLFAPHTFAACTGASPNLIAPTWQDVADCHNVAIPNDTITVVPGTYDVTSMTQITKVVRISGEGVLLIDDSCSGHCGDRDTDMIQIVDSPDGKTEFSGFTIMQGMALHAQPSGVIHLFTSGGKPVLVHDNSYTAVATSGDFIVAETPHGVIYHNAMTGDWFDSAGCLNNNSFVRNTWEGGIEFWQSPALWGAEDAQQDQKLYIEGNTVNGVLEAIDLDDDSRGVVAWNTLIDSGSGSHGTDTSGPLGARAFEFYYNNYIYGQTTAPVGSACGQSPGMTANVNSFLLFRGGTGVIHHNVIPPISSLAWGIKSDVTLFVEQLGRNAGPYACYGTALHPGSYPVPHQPGWGWTSGTADRYPYPSPPPKWGSQDPEPMYLWGNTGGGNYDNPFISGYPQDVEDPAACTTQGFPPVYDVSQFVEQGREFFTNADAPNGKPGYVMGACPNINTGLTGVCDINTPGADGYAAAAAPPPPPNSIPSASQR